MTLPYQALFFDLSGVLYDGTQAIPGASKIIQQARNSGLILRFVTNTASKSQQQVIAQLAEFKIIIEPDELFSAPQAAKSYILNHQLRPYCLINDALAIDFTSIPQADPNCILIGDSPDKLNFANLNKAFQLCHQGMPLITIGKNKYYKSSHGLCLEAGAFVHGLEWACDQKAIVMGKPSPQFFQQVINSTPFKAEQCLMIGDDIRGDVIAAMDVGLNACLVKTGKFQPDDIKLLPAKALLINSIADLY
jgi:HAD superfamily hydrolase (TIGR01458 family)